MSIIHQDPDSNLSDPDSNLSEPVSEEKGLKSVQFRICSKDFGLFSHYDRLLKKENFGNSDVRRYEAFLNGAKFLLGELDFDKEEEVKAVSVSKDTKDTEDAGKRSDLKEEKFEKGTLEHVLNLFLGFNKSKAVQRKA